MLGNGRSRSFWMVELKSARYGEVDVGGEEGEAGRPPSLPSLRLSLLRYSG